MKRTVIIAATIAAFGAITVAPLAAKSGGPRAGTSTSQDSSGTVGKIDAKPRINKSIGLRFHCYRVPHQDKLGIVIVKRECVAG